MPISLTTPVNIPNQATRLTLVVREDEDAQVLAVRVQLRPGAAAAGLPNGIFAEKTVEIRNGRCDRVRRNVSPAPGTDVRDLLLLDRGVLSLPSGFTDASAAWHTSRAALEAYLLSAGVIDSSLSGS